MDHFDDEHAGVGGEYLYDPATNTRTLVRPAATGESRVVERVIDLDVLLNETAPAIIAELPTLSSLQLMALEEKERSGKNRVTVLDAIAAQAAK